ncbi:Heme exporter protein CcmD [Devosia sp. LC5]|uniref:heme exporter protein CcmD n=1 Tax=Devosia sp. LC5 TaxID=1502724 RepID=UPI0004E3815D|nr:Heme exporter protein CcmD [Devosia sp. LC5]
MIDLGPHAIFIIAAYAGVTLAVAALIVWTRLDARRVAKKLADLEARGIRRRSAGPA